MQEIQISDMRFEKYIPAWEIRNVVRGLADRLNADYSEVKEEVVLISILDGSFIFMADLVRLLKFDHQVEFVKLKSYEGTESTGEVEILLDIHADLKGKHVVVVEDVVDSSLTIERFLEMVADSEPASVKVCVMLSKPEEHNDIVDLHYVGMEIPPVFLIGYGLDIDGKGRGLNDIYRLVV